MFERIFGKKEELKDMIVYWDGNTTVDDLVSDLDILGELMVKPSVFKNGSRIVTIKESAIDTTQYITAELMVDKITEKTIVEFIRNKKFAGVKFSETIIHKGRRTS